MKLNILFSSVVVQVNVVSAKIYEFFKYQYASQIYESDDTEKYDIRIVECEDKIEFFEQAKRNSAIEERFLTVTWFSNKDEIVFCVNNASQGVLYQFSLYLSHRMYALITKLNVYSLHGSCVCTPHKQDGVVLFGGSGCGKSSIALLLTHYYDYKIVTDDLLIMEKSTQKIKIEKNMRSIGISDSDFNCKYQNLHAFVEKAPFERKLRLNYYKYNPTAYISTCHPKQIFILQERADIPTIRQISFQTALMKLLQLHSYYGQDVADLLEIFEPLLKNCETYREIYESQFKKEDLKAGETA